VVVSTKAQENRGFEVRQLISLSASIPAEAPMDHCHGVRLRRAYLTSRNRRHWRSRSVHSYGSLRATRTSENYCSAEGDFPDFRDGCFVRPGFFGGEHSCRPRSGIGVKQRFCDDRGRGDVTRAGSSFRAIQVEYFINASWRLRRIIEAASASLWHRPLVPAKKPQLKQLEAESVLRQSRLLGAIPLCILRCAPF